MGPNGSRFNSLIYALGVMACIYVLMLTLGHWDVVWVSTIVLLLEGIYTGASIRVLWSRPEGAVVAEHWAQGIGESINVPPEYLEPHFASYGFAVNCVTLQVHVVSMAILTYCLLDSTYTGTLLWYVGPLAIARLGIKTALVVQDLREANKIGTETVLVIPLWRQTLVTLLNCVTLAAIVSVFATRLGFPF